MNAKEELLRSTKGIEIICAEIKYIDLKIYLKFGYTEEEFIKFLKLLDFNYDNGYGGQELYGKVWLGDNAWLERGEYDGSEWWSYKKLPEIPKYLK